MNTAGIKFEDINASKSALEDYPNGETSPGVEIVPPEAPEYVPPVDSGLDEGTKLLCGGLGDSLIDSENVECLNGFIGDIYTLGHSIAKGVVSVKSYFLEGQKVNSLVLGEEDVSDVKLVLPSIGIPTQSHTNGFMIDGTTLLDPREDSPKKLMEYFALNMSSVFYIPQESEDYKSNVIQESGSYQFALISDDGAIISVIDYQGNFLSELINNDGIHASKMSCSRVIEITKGEPIPLHLQYYQGPATEIALSLVWRKVEPNSNDDHLENCGKTSQNFYGTVGGGADPAYVIDDPQAGTMWAALVDQGWQVVSSKNLHRAYLLKP